MSDAASFVQFPHPGTEPRDQFLTVSEEVLYPISNTPPKPWQNCLTTGSCCPSLVIIGQNCGPASASTP